MVSPVPCRKSWLVSWEILIWINVMLHGGLMLLHMSAHRPRPRAEKKRSSPKARKKAEACMVVIFETASGKRITDASVLARISEPGLAPVQKKLEPMMVADAMSFGNYFSMGGAGAYSIKVTFVLPATKRRLETEFQYSAPR